MGVQLIPENRGHTPSKPVTLQEAPAVGSIVLADRERRVTSVEHVAERGETGVYLREDGDDLMMQVIPEAHLAFIEFMKRDGWDVEEERTLRVWLQNRIRRQGRTGPTNQN